MKNTKQTLRRYYVAVLKNKLYKFSFKPRFEKVERIKFNSIIPDFSENAEGFHQDMSLKGSSITIELLLSVNYFLI